MYGGLKIFFNPFFFDRLSDRLVNGVVDTVS
jgi:hypothetical protein